MTVALVSYQPAVILIGRNGNEKKHGKRLYPNRDAEKVALLTKQIYELQKRMYKEKQFNRQVEMNLQLQTLQKQLKDLTR